MYIAYDIALLLALLAALPVYALRGLRDRRLFRAMGERLGRLPESANPYALTGIWIQAVSVGEVLLARTLIRAIRSRAPEARFYLSTTTATGRGMAESDARGTADLLLYFPVDLSFSVRGTLDRLRPALFIAMETEIWPNLLRWLARRQVPALIVNGRISPEAYRRYRRARFFFRRVLRHLDLALMQTEEDAARLRELGMPPERVLVTGSLKYDTPPPADGDPELEALLGLRPEEMVFIAGSTLPGEEEIVLDAFREATRDRADAVLLLAPRHPPRFDGVAAMLQARSIPFVRRSALPAGNRPGRRVILLDSLGELPRLYPRGRVVFVGGSLVPRGGHNILEPAACGKPVIFGPHMSNFREAAERLLEGGGGIQVNDAAELAVAFEHLARDEVRFRAAGDAARAVVEANRGALERTLQQLDPFLRRFAPASC